jgi:hypothetical protein
MTESLSLRLRLRRHPVVKLALHPAITLSGLFILFLLILFGTLYQTDHGLYEAQRLYFGYGWVLVGGYFPLPSASVVLWVLTLQMILAMVVIMPLTWKKAGLWVVHSGLLLLMIGGFITQKLAIESQLTLNEGETGTFTTSYHEWEVAFWESQGDTQKVFAYLDTDLHPGTTLPLTPWDAEIQVETFYRNAAAFKSPVNDSVLFLNASGVGFIESRKPEKEVTLNNPALIFTLKTEGKPDRKILLFGMEVNPFLVSIGDKQVWCQLLRRRYPLPFAIKLDDFIRELHPGTHTAAAYESHVQILDGAASRPAKIWMNNPFREANLTFFQASFSQEQNGAETSTFAVVTNPGRQLPYYSSITVFVGLLLHFLIHFSGYVRKQGNRA